MHYKHIVSLGKDCFPRSIATKAGLKRRKAEGEKTLPFDLAIHPYKAVCELIESDFDGYMNAAHLGLNGRNFIVHKKYAGVTFNHESVRGRYARFSKNEFQLLIETYNRRVSDFYEYMSDGPILFVCDFQRYPYQLAEIISKKFPSLDFRFAAINNMMPRQEYVFSDVASQLYGELNKLHPAVDYYFVPLPKDKYIWHEANHSNTELGQRYNNYLSQILNRYFEGRTDIPV